MATILQTIKEAKAVISLTVVLSVAIISALTYFTPMSVFAGFRDQQEYKDAVRDRADLRREVRACKNALREYGQLTASETESCQEAEDELKDLRDYIEQRWK